MMDYKIYASTDYDSYFCAYTYSKEDAFYVQQMLIDSSHWDYVSVSEIDREYKVMEEWSNG